VPTSPSTSCGLALGDGDRSFGEVGAEQELRRGAGALVEIGIAEGAAKEGADSLRLEGVGNADRSTRLPAVATVVASAEPDRRRPIEIYRRLSDADLVRKANGGDHRALDALVERYAGKVSRLSAQILGDIEDARDAAQESLLKLSVRLRQFRGECLFSTWLHRLVVNTCRDLAERQRLRRGESLDSAHDDIGTEYDDPSRLAQLGDLRRELAAALSRLTADQRRVLLLRDTLDLSYEEIGRLVRIPVGTAKSYVHRGRENLRRRLHEYSSA
jgi:RNA polymerase sigma-70 factor (ECF subfamily)